MQGPRGAGVSRRMFEEGVQWVDSIKRRGVDAPRFLNWARRSPQHVEAFFEAWATWHDVASVSPRQRERIERLARKFKRGVGNPRA